MRQKYGILLAVVLVLSASIELSARKQRTIRANVNGRAATVEQQAMAKADSIVIPDSAQVKLYGYDKPLRSRRETVFVSNNTDYDIQSLTITTQYVDGKGRQFHQSTRRIDEYPSWDTQQSFYYVGSKRARVSGTPYNVRQTVDTIFVSRN